MTAKRWTLFEQAIQLARDAGAVLYEALANELAGRYAERRGWTQMARELYFKNASVAYARWGDPRKAKQLAARVPEPRHRAQVLTAEMPAVGWSARLMEISIEQAGAERGLLLLIRNGELWVECAAGRNSDDFTRFCLQAHAQPAETASASSVPALQLPRTIIDFVLQAREKVVLTTASEPNRFSADPYLAQHKPQSLLCLPMIRQGALIGVLYLENRLAADVFDADRIELLEMLSTQAAISLENARLYEEMEGRVKDRTHKLEESLRTIREDQAKLIEAERRAAVAHLESELAIARRIQTSILPRDLSVAGMEIAASMQTATEVGGDYYDVLPTEDGGFWLGIGDVSGHGLDAGLVMLMLQSGLATLMRSDAWVDPAKPLCLLNRAIYDNVRCRLQRDDYVTLSLFRFFPDGRYLVAGAHEDILVWRAQSGRCEAIQPQGTWIGMLDRIESATHSREGYLADGDVMVLFTDGVVEARKSEQGQFGLDRVVEIATQAHAEPATEICRHILDQAQAWSVDRQDDQTVVVLRRGTRR
jgi:serine phosphatase RsbU (regulator of sigma subunit)